jgi:hypothetical protein
MAMYPVISKYPNSLKSLTIDAKVRVMSLPETAPALETLALHNSMLYGKIPATTQRIKLYSVIAMDDNCLEDCRSLKHLSFDNCGISKHISLVVWRDIIGPSLQTYADTDTLTLTCMGTKHLTNLRSFIVSSYSALPRTHLFNLPLSSPNLEYVSLTNTISPVLIEYAMLKARVPNLELKGPFGWQ